MKKRKGRLVTNQGTDIINGHDTREDSSPYWDYANRSGIDKEGNLKENIHANPDHLTDEDENKLWGNGVQVELAGRIVEEFADEHGNFPVLSKQENLVLRLFITTGDMKEVQKVSKLSLSSINTYMARIRSKMLRLLKSRDF